MVSYRPMTDPVAKVWAVCLSRILEGFSGLHIHAYTVKVHTCLSPTTVQIHMHKIKKEKDVSKLL